MLPTRYMTQFTVAAADATGFAAAATGAAWALAANDAGDSLGHRVTIVNLSATDHSAKTAVITGTYNGTALTETVNLPGAGLTVTSTKFFDTVTSIVPSATIGADTMNLGWTAEAVSPYVKLDAMQNGFSVSVAVAVSGTINYDVEHAYEVLNGDAVAFKHSGLTAVVANDDGQYVAPIYGVRVHVNSHTSGVFTFYVLQGDRS